METPRETRAAVCRDTKRQDTEKLLEQFTVVRLDALSEESIVDVSGKASTAKDFAADLGIDPRPGAVLFDKGKEIIRIGGMLRSFHFQQVLRYETENERHHLAPIASAGVFWPAGGR